MSFRGIFAALHTYFRSRISLQRLHFVLLAIFKDFLRPAKIFSPECFDALLIYSAFIFRDDDSSRFIFTGLLSPIFFDSRAPFHDFIVSLHALH